MKNRVASLCALLLPLASLCCATVDSIKTEIDELKEPVSAQWASEGSKVEHDQYRQTSSLRAPSLKKKIGKKGAYYRAHLRGVVGKNGAESFRLYVATHLRGHWHNLNSALDQDRIPLVVSKVARKKQCDEKDCSYYEHFSVPLTKEYLETRQRSGVTLVVSGPNDEVTVVVPAAYVEGFLNRFGSELAARGGTEESPHRAAKLSYCEAKYGSDEQALRFCREQARASYERLRPAVTRAKADSFTAEAKLLEGCMRRHNGSLGIDWMLVEHCYGKGTSPSQHGPASR